LLIHLFYFFLTGMCNCRIYFPTNIILANSLHILYLIKLKNNNNCIKKIMLHAGIVFDSPNCDLFKTNFSKIINNENQLLLKF